MLVIDASVAIKWVLAEPDSATAEALLTSGARLMAPDLLVTEVVNAAWNAWCRG